MFDFTMYLSVLVVLLLAGIAGWISSYARQNVTIVDSLWALFFLLAALTYVALTPLPGPRATILVVLVTVWAARLSGYLSWRNWGKTEDHRYQEIRRRNEPGFAFKSLYLVFGVQAVLPGSSPRRSPPASLVKHHSACSTMSALRCGRLVSCLKPLVTGN